MGNVLKHRPSYVLSGANGCESDNGDVAVPSFASSRFARRPCFELLCTNIWSEIAINGPSTDTCVAITTYEKICANNQILMSIYFQLFINLKLVQQKQMSKHLNLRVKIFLRTKKKEIKLLISCFSAQITTIFDIGIKIDLFVWFRTIHLIQMQHIQMQWFRLLSDSSCLKIIIEDKSERERAR